VFDKDSRFNKLGQDIWVYHNFLSKEELNAILNKINSSSESLWQGEYPKNQSTGHLQEASIISSRIQNLLPKGLNVHAHASITKLTIGQGHGIHSDNHDFLKLRELGQSLKDNECFKVVDNNVYGLVVYINDDYEGGEIFYTKQNITYKPKSGDLLIHSAENHCEHGVNPLKTNIRYSFPSSIREKIKIPC
jgi:hypothetical protein